MKVLFLTVLSLCLTACSHNPPKPYGRFFPINSTTVQTQTVIIADQPSAERLHHD